MHYPTLKQLSLEVLDIDQEAFSNLQLCTVETASFTKMNVTSLPKMPVCQKLDLFMSTGFQSPTSLCVQEKCPKLKELNIGSTKIVDLKGLEGMELEIVSAVNCCDLVDISQIASFLNLVFIDFDLSPNVNQNIPNTTNLINFSKEGVLSFRYEKNKLGKPCTYHKGKTEVYNKLEINAGGMRFDL
jgi:hypothetical protein